MITMSDYYRLMCAADGCSSLDEYIAECGGSVPADCIGPDGDAAKAIRLLTLLWELHKDRSFPAVRRLSGMSQNTFCVTYQIPLGTIHGWCAAADTASRTAPQYVIDLLACDIINRIIRGDLDAPEDM